MLHSIPGMILKEILKEIPKESSMEVASNSLGMLKEVFRGFPMEFLRDFLKYPSGNSNGFPGESMRKSLRDYLWASLDMS